MDHEDGEVEGMIDSIVFRILYGQTKEEIGKHLIEEKKIPSEEAFLYYQAAAILAKEAQNNASNGY